MKKVNLGVIAVVLGLTTALAGSALTPETTQDIYVLTSQGYQLKLLVEDQEYCVSQPDQCEYIKLQ